MTDTLTENPAANSAGRSELASETAVAYTASVETAMRIARCAFLGLSVALLILPLALAQNGPKRDQQPLRTQIARDKKLTKEGFIEQLRKEGKFPEWANYVCFDDTIAPDSGHFILMAYSPAVASIVEHAIKLGYRRGLTFQEYIGFDDRVVPMNPSPSEQDVERSMKNLASADTSDLRQDVLIEIIAQLRAMQNAAAVAKAASTVVTEDKRNSLMKALLDYPNGANYKVFIRENSAFPHSNYIMQKYANGTEGVLTKVLSPEQFAPEDGQVIYENSYGTEQFVTEIEGAVDKVSEAKIIRTGIQMRTSGSQLRFSMFHIVGDSSLGVPNSGKCELITDARAIQSASVSQTEREKEPNLQETVVVLNRMVEPEGRKITTSSAACTLNMTNSRQYEIAIITGVDRTDSNAPEPIVSIYREGGPVLVFDLKDVDPDSIMTGNAMSRRYISEHPSWKVDHEHLDLHSVFFTTRDSNKSVRVGHFEGKKFIESETFSGQFVVFESKERAERFKTVVLRC